MPFSILFFLYYLRGKQQIDDLWLRAARALFRKEFYALTRSHVPVVEDSRVDPRVEIADPFSGCLVAEDRNDPVDGTLLTSRLAFKEGVLPLIL